MSLLVCLALLAALGAGYGIARWEEHRRWRLWFAVGERGIPMRYRGAYSITDQYMTELCQAFGIPASLFEDNVSPPAGGR